MNMYQTMQKLWCLIANTVKYVVMPNTGPTQNPPSFGEHTTPLINKFNGSPPNIFSILSLGPDESLCTI